MKEEKIITNFKGNLVDYIDKLTKERDLYKSVIDEVRECIEDEKFKVDNPTDYYFNCELIDLHNLLEILDKVKENNNV